MRFRLTNAVSENQISECSEFSRSHHSAPPEGAALSRPSIGAVKFLHGHRGQNANCAQNTQAEAPVAHWPQIQGPADGKPPMRYPN